jgi:hypothetical protein
MPVLAFGLQASQLMLLDQVRIVHLVWAWKYVRLNIIVDTESRSFLGNVPRGRNEIPTPQ